MNKKFFLIALYSSVLNFLTVPFSSSIASIFGYATIICFFGSVLYPAIMNKTFDWDKNLLVFIGLIFLSLLTNIKSWDQNFISNIIGNVISIVSFVTFYMALSRPIQKTGELFLEHIFPANYLLSAVLLAFAIGPFDFKYSVVNEYGRKQFTLGLGNPNATAMVVMFCIMVLLIQIFTDKRKVFINVLLISGLTYVLFMLSSRTVIVCVMIVLVFGIIKSQKIINFASHFAVFAPAVLFVFQMLFLEGSLDIKILGKTLDTGRPEMYKELLGVVIDNPIMIILGNVVKYPFYNAHNGLLTMLISLGGIGIIVYFVFWLNRLEILRNVCITKIQNIAFVSILAFLLHSSSESMSVIGTIPYSLYVIIIMRIALGEIRSRND